MRKKFFIFKDNIAHINQMISQGYTYNDIISDLKENHSLDLSFNTFNSYLYRYRNENPSDKIEVKNDKDNTKVESEKGGIKESIPATTSLKTNVADNDIEPEKKQSFSSRKDGEDYIAKLLDENKSN